MGVGEKLKGVKKTTATELPEEVIREEILTRLPIKSVVRFKSVSKSWLSLFSHPDFVKQHLTRNNTQNPSDYDCLVAKKDSTIVILSRYKETFSLPSKHFCLIGCVQGLVCLHHDIKFSLWNPAIHQCKEFTLPPHCDDIDDDIGLGYDPVSNNYKIVVLSDDSSSATVYYSNSDSWIDISVPDHVFPKNRGDCSTYNPITIVKDCPYWTFARHLSNVDALSLTAVKFDAGSDEFKLLPEFYFDKNIHERNYEFVDMNDRLTLILYDQDSSNCMLDIYSVHGEEGCCIWSKMYSIGPLNFHSRGLYGLVSQGFQYGGEIVYHVQGMFFCYDLKTDTIKRLTTTSTFASFVSWFRYIPSLVFLQGMKSVYLTTQTRRTAGLCSTIPRRLINSLRN